MTMITNPLPAAPLDDQTCERIDSIAQDFIDAVHQGDAPAIARLTLGLDRTQLIGLAISVASLAESEITTLPILALVDATEGWSTPELRAAHAAYSAGDRRKKTAHGERIYQRLKKQEHRQQNRKAAQ